MPLRCRALWVRGAGSSASIAGAPAAGPASVEQTSDPESGRVRRRKRILAAVCQPPPTETMRHAAATHLATTGRAVVFLVALAAVVSAPDLPALVPFSRPWGAALALVTLALLAATVVLGLGRLLGDRNKQRLIADIYSRRPITVSAAALVWIFAAVHPVPVDHLNQTEFYRVAASLLAPLAGAILTVFAAAHLAPAREGPARRLAAPLALVLAAALTAGGALAMAAFAFGWAPHIPDEVAYLFDARVFAAGRRFAEPPPLAAAFPAPEWIEIETSRTYGVFPPGWPFLLALGVRLGFPGIVNAIAAALIVLYTARLARLGRAGEPAGLPEMSGRLISPLLPAWLAATSPFLLVLAGSLMAHVAALLWTVIALVSFASLSGMASAPLSGGPRGRGSSLSLALALILAATLLVLTRPIEAAAFALACLSAVLAARRGGRAVLILGAGLAAGALLLLADQARITGSPLVPPVNRYFDTHFLPGANQLGFGPDRGLTWDSSLPGHTPIEALWNLCLNLEQLNRHLGGWPAGSLMLPLLFLFAVKKTRLEELLLLHAAFVLGLYALYWYHGVVLGPRFLAGLIPGFMIFTWRGAEALATWLERSWPDQNMARRVRTAIAFSMGCALVLYLPLKVAIEYRGLRGVDPDIVRQVAAAPTPALAFIQGPRWPDYSSAYFFNAPDFHGPRVVALSRGPAADSALARMYPEYTPCIVQPRPAVGAPRRNKADELE